MAKKMWVWKDPNPKTGEKGVIMQLRMHSYHKWRTKHLRHFSKVKQHYNLLLGEHMEVQNPMYDKLIRDHYKTYIREFDLWFYATQHSRRHIRNISHLRSDKVPNMHMSAVCYLINQDYWVPDPTVPKQYDFMVCFNDLISYKRPEWALGLWTTWCRRFGYNRKFAFVYSNIYGNMMSVCNSQIAKTGNVDMIRSPQPDEILKLYQQSRFLLHPSRTESAPRVVGEALSCNTPCIIPQEAWAESVAHLHPGCLVLPKEAWKLGTQIDDIVEFERRFKGQDLRSLVNTQGYLKQIDNKLAESNKVWTKGQLRPPHFIGSHIDAQESDKLFTKLTGDALV